MSDAPTSRGRRSKFNAEIVAQICESIGEGVPLQYASALAGISHETFHNWQRKFPSFKEAVQLAIAKGVKLRLKKIREAGETDWRACAWYLEHVFPNDFARNRIELSGPNGTPLSAGIEIYLPKKESTAEIEVNEVKALPEDKS